MVRNAVFFRVAWFIGSLHSKVSISMSCIESSSIFLLGVEIKLNILKVLLPSFQMFLIYSNCLFPVLSEQSMLVQHSKLQRVPTQCSQRRLGNERHKFFLVLVSVVVCGQGGEVK